MRAVRNVDAKVRENVQCPRLNYLNYTFDVGRSTLRVQIWGVAP